MMMMMMMMMVMAMMAIERMMIMVIVANYLTIMGTIHYFQTLMDEHRIDDNHCLGGYDRQIYHHRLPQWPPRYVLPGIERGRPWRVPYLLSFSLHERLERRSCYYHRHQQLRSNIHHHHYCLFYVCHISRYLA